MQEKIILDAISIENFLSKIDGLIQKRLNEKFNAPKTRDEITYMTRKEVARFLKISLPTLHDWTKLGMIPSYKIGTRVYYKTDEVSTALRRTNYLKHKNF
jgi:excisionase family DNA binding protein